MPCAAREFSVRTVLVCALGGVAACAGSEPQDLLASTSSTLPEDDASPGSSSPGSGSADGGDTAVPTDGGDGLFGACDEEKEPNNTPAQANALRTCLRGLVGGADPVDIITFRLPEGAKNPKLEVSGVVRLVGNSNDNAFVLPGSGDIPPSRGKYTVQITSTLPSGLATAWSVTFTAN